MSLTPISQKAHDISFATFRCATLFKNPKLRAEIESAAVDLVAHLTDVASAIENSVKIENSKLNIDPIERLESLVSLAESIGEMKAVNASVLKRELGNLQTAIDFHINTFKGHPGDLSGKEDIDISSMFPSSALTSGNPASKNRNSDIKNSLEIRNSKFVPNGNNPGTDESLNPKPQSLVTDSEPTVRQMAILRNIREIEFCRLRNIVEAMPNISERTIRNDIQGLIEKGLVRRVGGGGPNSYFQTMELALSNSPSRVS